MIGTPGRLNDLVQEGSLNSEKVSMVVLDEADRMLDLGNEIHHIIFLGFEPSIK